MFLYCGGVGGVERVLGSAVWITAGGVVMSVAGLVFWGVVARVLGPVGLGEVASAVSLANVASALLNLGFQQFVLRFVPSAGGSAFWAGFLGSAAVGVAAFSALGLVGSFWSGVLAFLFLTSGAALGGLIALGRARLYFAAVSLGAVLKVVLAALRFPPMLVFVGTSALSLAVALLGVVSVVGWSRPAGWRSLLASAVANYPLNFSASFGVSVGVLLVRWVAGAEVAGVFYLLSTAVLAVGSVSGALATSSIPVMAAGGTGLVGRGARIAVGVNVPLVVGAGGASHFLLSILGRGYVGYGLDLALALPAAVGLAAVSLASALYNVEGRWLKLGGLGLLSAASVTAASLAVPHIGVGPAVLLGALPPALVGGRDVGLWPFVVGLGVSAVLSPVAALWIAAAPAAVGASVALLHVSGVFRLGEYRDVARLVLRSL